ncbi:MAG: metallophosphoesterase [Bacteroidales bacterium]|nr:metallophosphoesterase [Bacteroidales bacterium]
MKNILKISLVIITMLTAMALSAFSSYGQSSDCVVLMRTQPYLQMPSDNSMVIRWVTAFPCTGEVEYTTDPSFQINIQTVFSTDSTFIQKIQLTGLSIGTKYYYRVHSIDCEGKRAETSPIYNFKTFPEVDSDFKVIIFNDLHPMTRQERLVNFMTKIKPYIDTIQHDLTIFNGDCFDEVAEEKDLIYWTNEYTKMSDNSRIPSVYIAGNHEYDNKMADIPGRFQNMKLKKYIDFVQDGQGYGAMRLGKTQFLFLDIGQDGGQVGLANKYPQFEQDTAYFKQYRKTQKSYIIELLSDDSIPTILVHHIPFFSTGDPNIHWKEAYYEIGGPALNRLNIKLSINGHTHHFDTIVKKTSLSSDYRNNYPILITDGPYGPWESNYHVSHINAFSMTVLRKEGSDLFIDYYTMNNGLEIHVKHFKVSDVGINEYF